MRNFILKALMCFVFVLIAATLSEAADLETEAVYSNNPTAKIAGVWDYRGSGTIDRDLQGTVTSCANSFSGVIIVTKNGEFSTSGNFRDECLGDFSSSDSGTITFNISRYGVLTYNDGDAYNYQASKDLKSIIYSSMSPGVYLSGTALKR